MKLRLKTVLLLAFIVLTGLISNDRSGPIQTRPRARKVISIVNCDDRPICVEDITFPAIYITSKND